MNVHFSQSRARYFGVGPVLVACLFALTLTDILWMPLRLLHQRYPDPVAGAITLSDIDKSRDMHAFLLLLGTAVVAAVGITVLGRSIATPDRGEPDRGENIASDVTTQVNQLLLFSLIPAAYRLAAACVHPVNLVPPLRYVTVFPLGAVLALLLLSRHRKSLQGRDVLVLGGAILLAPVMAAFSAIGILLAIARIRPQLIVKLSPYGPGCVVTFAGCAIAATAIVWILSTTLETFRGRILRVLMACQFPTALLVLFLVPPHLVDLSHQFRNPYPTGLVITLSCIAVAGIGIMYRRFRSTLKPGLLNPDFPLGKAISPFAVMAITIFCICGTASLPMASSEFFHAGEGFTPWQQIWDCHCVPYVDFAPVHGLMEIVCGALNQLFFDGSAANYFAAQALLGGLSVAALSLAASECVSPVAALIFVLSLMPGDRFYFVAAGLFAIAAPSVVARPVRWLTAWLVIGFLSCGYNGAMGPAFVLSTAPFALWQFWRAIKTRRGALAVLVAVVAVLGAVMGLVTPLRIFSLAFIHFVFDNAWTNEVANGIAWTQGLWLRDQGIGFGTSQFLWEISRFSWVFVLIGGLVLTWKQWSKPAGQRNVPAIILSTSTACVLFWSSFWIIERLDPGGVSRPGAITDVAVYFLLPIMVFLALPQGRRGVAALLVVTLMGLMSKGLPTNIDYEVLASRPFDTRVIPADTAMIDGPAIGIPRLGQIIKPEPDFIINLLSLKKVLSQLLRPGETYFDLTNLTANYFYLGLPSPGQYAPYVAANSRMQAVMMQHVREHPNVPVMLIYPSGQLDGVPMALRCYRPYHDFLLKYTVYEKDGFMFLVDPARNAAAGPVGTEAQLKRLDSVFRMEDLQRLPIAWGDSFGAMKSRFETVSSAGFASGPKTGPTRSWTCNIPAAASSGTAADFVLLHCDFVPADARAYRDARRIEPPTGFVEPKLSLTWTSRNGEVSEPIKFLGQSGNLLIPLGGYPRWLLGSGFAEMKITLANPKCATAISISKAQFLRLIPLP